MKVAALDVGSNSIHMIVAEASHGRDVRVLDRAKDMARLGDSAFGDGRLSASAQARAISTIGRLLSLAKRHRVDAVVAAATSAVREAANGTAFLALVRRETGQHVALLSEQEEARLIYLAVRHAVDLRGRPSLVVDVGGGSVEVVVGDATAMRAVESLPLGILRLKAEFGGKAALKGKERKALREHVRETFAPFARRARALRVRQAIGTAGTLQAIARVLRAAEGAGGDDEVPSGVRIARDRVFELGEALLSMPLADRQRVPGLEPERADAIGYGAVVLSEILHGAGAEELRTCRATLREGMVIDWLATHPRRPARRAAHDVRERSVRDAAARYGESLEHAEYVATLALALFDGTKRLHRLGKDERELLEYACLLHDVGQHVEYRRHHRHSHYLIKNADLQGFDPEEVETLAVVARYHRKGGPKEDHEEWRALAPSRRPAALALTAILRVADGLDRGHGQRLRAPKVEVRRREVVLGVRGTGDASLERWGGAVKADLFEQVFGRPLRIASSGGGRGG
jgi:exopolyphosphatase/guanosine-5'-triphosphate,3'-diphosphate pyrophosphatase